MMKVRISFATGNGDRTFPPLQIKAEADATATQVLAMVNKRGIPANAGWGCSRVRLRGCVSYSDIQNENAMLTEILSSFALAECLLEDDCLVVEAAAEQRCPPIGGDSSRVSDVETSFVFDSDKTNEPGTNHWHLPSVLRPVGESVSPLTTADQGLEEDRTSRQASNEQNAASMPSSSSQVVGAAQDMAQKARPHPAQPPSSSAASPPLMAPATPVRGDGREAAKSAAAAASRKRGRRSRSGRTSPTRRSSRLSKRDGEEGLARERATRVRETLDSYGELDDEEDEGANGEEVKDNNNDDESTTNANRSDENQAEAAAAAVATTTTAASHNVSASAASSSRRQDQTSQDSPHRNLFEARVASEREHLQSKPACGRGKRGGDWDEAISISSTSESEEGRAADESDKKQNLAASVPISICSSLDGESTSDGSSESGTDTIDHEDEKIRQPTIAERASPAPSASESKLNFSTFNEAKEHKQGCKGKANSSTSEQISPRHSKRKRLKTAKSDLGSEHFPPRKKRREPLIVSPKLNRSHPVDGFVKHNIDGICYPVRLASSDGKATGHDKVGVIYNGYGNRVHTISKNELLPVTNERVRDYERAVEIAKTAVNRKKALAGRKGKERKINAQLKRKQREEEKEAIRRKEALASRKKSEEERARFGPPLTRSGLPTSRSDLPSAVEEGRHISSLDRIVYFAVDDETPQQISEKFGLPVARILYDNRIEFKNITARCKLKSCTPIVMPLNGATGAFNREIVTDSPTDTRVFV